MKVNGVIYLCLFLLLTACSDKSEPFSERDRIAVRFSLSGIQAEGSTRADGNGTSPLTEGTTLRILAFRRVGTNADLSKDEYMGEGTYKANSGGLLTAVNSLLLPQGTYDFYALTPSLTVNRASTPCTVSVNHGVDYASSTEVTTATVTENNSSVTLAALTRRCTKLNFAILPKDGSGITSLTIIEIRLSNMTDAPLKGELSKALPIETTRKTTITLSGEAFTATTEKPLDYSASTIVLSRKAGAFDFKMKASIGCQEGTGEKVYSAPLPADIAFLPGCQYTFTVKMKGGKDELVLSVQQWGNNFLDAGDMGDYYTTTLTVESGWKENPWTDEDGLGGTANK
ncbi:BF2992 family fimbrillin-A clan protein [Bacteroides sp.]|uniref:BF2992 family fimbrillin-A clan protein n=1 Tax=Bacteroides sp. TaxID=29523 RepID=UPI003AB3440C